MKPLEFAYKDRSYFLRFNKFNIIFIVDGVCKTLMCEDLKEVCKQDKAFANVCVFDIYNSDKVLPVLKSKETYEKYKYFVINNADILVTPEVNNIINSHRDRFWVIIGRRLPNCVLSLCSICKLSEVSPKHFECDYNVI